MFENLTDDEKTILELTQLSRIEKLCTLMVRRELTFTKIAEKLDITAACLSRHLKSATLPPNRHAELVSIGFLPELLPPPVYQKFGPKPKDKSAAA